MTGGGGGVLTMADEITERENGVSSRMFSERKETVVTHSEACTWDPWQVRACATKRTVAKREITSVLILR